MFKIHHGKRQRERDIATSNMSFFSFFFRERLSPFYTNKDVKFGKYIFSAAFTLAEVLITLGIIGVIAAMTIPTLLQKQQEMATVEALKKAYATVSQAYGLAVQENGSPENWSADAATILTTLSPFLKIIKNCGTSAGCWPSDYYKLLSGGPRTRYFDSDSTYAKAQLADGSLLLVYFNNKDCAGVRGTSLALSNICSLAGVDINGFKEPNQDGRDFFQFYITKYGVVPVGTQMESDTYNSFATSCQSTLKTGYGCAAWVIYNENMDYLHCSDLAWGDKSKCS